VQQLIRLRNPAPTTRLDESTPRLVALTPHQQAALDWLVERVLAGAPWVALRGLAGTGKTTLIPAVRAALEAAGREVCLGTPTHRAMMILRRKGMWDANTVHAHALRPVFTEDYTAALR
jgi:predicted ribonuclease YlaK